MYLDSFMHSWKIEFERQNIMQTEDPTMEMVEVFMGMKDKELTSEQKKKENKNEQKKRKNKAKGNRSTKKNKNMTKEDYEKIKPWEDCPKHPGEHKWGDCNKNFNKKKHWDDRGHSG